jgi:hypothetical protein
LRGPTGHIALDFLLISKATHAEVGRIRNFIDKYIGEVDETAEFRTIELFQDWTEEASGLLQRITKAVETPISKGLPRDEVARLTPELSSYYQAFFQKKLVHLNQFISDFMNLFEKAWNGPASNFYEKVLGPGLVFQRTVGKALTDTAAADTNKFPTLVAESQAGLTGMAGEFRAALHDQLTRNKSYYNYVFGVLTNYEQRDTYKNVIGQLSGKGTTLIDSFVDSASLLQADDILDAPHPLYTNSVPANSTSLHPSHQDLQDREDPDAHPQYVLSDGGVISGNVTFTKDGRIDGIIPSKHRHDGKDGSVKIHGSHIEYGSITDDNVNSDATTNVPSNLALSNIVSTFATRVTVEVEFDVDPTNIVNYEFQYAKLT